MLGFFLLSLWFSFFVFNNSVPPIVVGSMVSEFGRVIDGDVVSLIELDEEEEGNQVEHQQKPVGFLRTGIVQHASVASNTGSSNKPDNSPQQTVMRDREFGTNDGRKLS